MMGVIGAFCFGLVIGWLVYFTNRYRDGEIAFKDIGTLIGIIGGGAVTALFGEGRALLFGAYGAGLAGGFFAYFVVLVVFLTRSGRYDLSDVVLGIPVPKDDEDTRRPILMGPVPGGGDGDEADRSKGGAKRSGPPSFFPSASDAGGAEGPFRSAEEVRRAIDAAEAATEAARAARNDEAAPIEQRLAMAPVVDALWRQQIALGRIETGFYLRDPAVQGALGALKETTTALTEEAARIEGITETIRKAQAMISVVTGAVGTLLGLPG